MSLTKQDGLKIARKLKARLDRKKKRRPHDKYDVYVDGVLITSIGINRGPRRDSGHGHLSHQLRLTQQQTKNVADCPIIQRRTDQDLEEKGNHRKLVKTHPIRTLPHFGVQRTLRTGS